MPRGRNAARETPGSVRVCVYVCVLGELIVKKIWWKIPPKFNPSAAAAVGYGEDRQK